MKKEFLLKTIQPLTALEDGEAHIMRDHNTEIKVTAVDVSTNRSVRAAIDFLSN